MNKILDDNEKDITEAVQGFVAFCVHDGFPAAFGGNRMAMASAAWSLYMTTAANIQIEVLKAVAGDPSRHAEVLAKHREALRTHAAFIIQVAESSTEAEVLARMNMQASSVLPYGGRWSSTEDVRG